MFVPCCVRARPPPRRYLEGKYLFDIHPPLGKLVLTLVGWIFGYDPSVCQYDHIHQVYQPECKFLVLRVTAGGLPFAVCVCDSVGGRGWAAGLLICGSVGSDVANVLLECMSCSEACVCACGRMFSSVLPVCSVV